MQTLLATEAAEVNAATASTFDGIGGNPVDVDRPRDHGNADRSHVGNRMGRHQAHPTVCGHRLTGGTNNGNLEWCGSPPAHLQPCRGEEHFVWTAHVEQVDTFK